MEGRKIVITGAGRGLGRALAIVVASRGATPILLGRSQNALQEVCDTIKSQSGRTAHAIICDLSDPTSVAHATNQIAESHPDIDILVNNGAHFTEGSFDKQTDDQIMSVVNSAVTGTMILTRQLLPLLKQRPRADIHNVVSMSGLQYARLTGASLPFRAAKAAQDGFTQGLVEELKGSSVRITSLYPGLFEDLSPTSPEWRKERGSDDGMTNKDVVDAIVYALSAPPNVSLRSIVIERTHSDFLV
ncbi:nadp-dependent l-serine l-allo-threonine dehydrogenase ydfg [Fusarium austroafricanum]|uniref:Nadp-dependent l-serine l-allo-threonine dehydrogenase ydfg n=1 Tax=Fusarium austroafricanum TaxID=2364996 RepID=A0A8H4K9W9_9HYPO|nr:nadp-dependent l-serine l-allo-threonine dehydrogenase ydfg [Fusarium austroafricanum]